MFDITVIFKVIVAALTTWNNERKLRNSPEMIENALDKAKQEARDALRIAMAVTSNPNSTPEQKLEAMKAIRLAGS
jgi:Tfp pilus assembly protein FimT